MFKGKEVAEIALPKKVVVPRHEQEPPPDPERDVLVAAAVQLEQHRRQRDDLRKQILALKDEMKEKLIGAQLLIEARDMKITDASPTNGRDAAVAGELAAAAAADLPSANEVRFPRNSCQKSGSLIVCPQRVGHLCHL